jgi:uncharacterized protein (DUF1501 family)
MDLLTRRRFLIASGVAGGTALAAGSAGIGLAELLATAAVDPPPAWAKRPVNRLVLVTLYGGNDGLSTVIPYTEDAYHHARPTLAYQPNEVIDLDGTLGLNPGMRGFKRLWDQKHLAIVLGVGYPKPDHSHFRSMDIWQTASPAVPVTTGWVGRWLDGTNATREAAVSFESVLPVVLAGATRTGACIGYRGLTLPKWLDESAVLGLGRDEPHESVTQAQAAMAYNDLIKMSHLLRDSHSISPAAGASAAPPGYTSGQNMLMAQLAQVARCVEVGVPTRVFTVSLGGFDTHADERGAQQALVTQLDAALSSFMDRLAQTDAGRRVAVVVYSEFGRRVKANDSDGTDHGTAGPMFVLGSNVAGGFYGTQPSLTDLDDGDLKANTDFRDIFGTVLDSVLEADPSQYLGGYKPHLLPLFPPG